MLNHPSRLILNIVAPGIEGFIKTRFNNAITAISSLMNNENIPKGFIEIIHIILKGTIQDSDIRILTEKMHPSIINDFINFQKSKLNQIKTITGILFRDVITIELKDSLTKKEINYDNLGTEKKCIRIDLSVKNNEDEYYLIILISNKFFRFFSKGDNIDTEDTYQIEHNIIQFFTNPFNIFPKMKTVLENFSQRELQDLLYQLRKNKLLTPYQVALILTNFPGHSIQIRENLSSNMREEVNEIMRKMHESDKFTKRDLIGGIYSIEEGIYMLMKKNENFEYSKFLSSIQEIIQVISNIETLFKKNFRDWIEEMKTTGLLFQTISITKESDIVGFISDNPEMYYSILSEGLSKSKLKNIIELSGNSNPTYAEKIEARSNFISNYRKLKIKKAYTGYENFKILISCITNPEDINHLLLKVGWFVLSTALKNIEKKYALKLIESVPQGASYLIIDVLQGIINPNIIHDEMQINKAREVCVEELLSLHESGIIHLS